MKRQNLLKFSAVMFFAAAMYLLLTGIMQSESRILYIALGGISLIAGGVMSAKARG